MEGDGGDFCLGVERDRLIKKAVGIGCLYKILSAIIILHNLFNKNSKHSYFSSICQHL